MRKSLLVTSYFPPMTGGISKSLYHFYLNFPKDTLIVLTDQPKKNNIDKNIISKKFFYKFKFIWPKWLPLIFSTIKVVKKHRINLIQVGQVIPHGYAAWFIKIFFKIPYVVYVYGQDLLINKKNLSKYNKIKKVLTSSSAIIVNSNYTKELVEDMGIIKKIIVVYPCPQDIKSEASNEKINEFFNKNQLNNKKILITVGNLVKRKGQDRVIEAVKKVREHINNLVYIIVGNGPYQKELQNIICEQGLDKTVMIKNNIQDSELALYYQAADVFVMPARILKDYQGDPIDVEGFGMVFLEANLFGLPVVGGNNGGQIDAIEHEKTGLLVDADNVSEITNALLRILNNKDFAKKMGDYGRNRVLKKFNWRNQTSKIIELVKNLE